MPEDKDAKGSESFWKWAAAIGTASGAIIAALITAWATLRTPAITEAQQLRSELDKAHIEVLDKTAEIKRLNEQVMHLTADNSSLQKENSALQARVVRTLERIPVTLSARIAEYGGSSEIITVFIKNDHVDDTGLFFGPDKPTLRTYGGQRLEATASSKYSDNFCSLPSAKDCLASSAQHPLTVQAGATMPIEFDFSLPSYNSPMTGDLTIQVIFTDGLRHTFDLAVANK